MCKFINYIQKSVISYTKITLQFSFFYLMAQNVHFISPTLATTFFSY